MWTKHLNMEKACDRCQMVFKKRPNENSKYWATKKYCSSKCYGLDKRGIIPSCVKLWEKGIHVSPNTEFKKGQTSLRKGVKQPQSEEQLEKRIKTLARGEKHWNWKGGITPLNEQIRKSLEYKQWRMAIFQRDKFTCINCGQRSQGKDAGSALALLPHQDPILINPHTRDPCNNLVFYAIIGTVEQKSTN